MAIMASVCLTLFINIFFRKSFAFRCDFIQLLLLAGLSFTRPDTLTLALFVAGFGALAIGKEAFPEQLSRVSLLLPYWDQQVTGQSRQHRPNPMKLVFLALSPTGHTQLRVHTLLRLYCPPNRRAQSA